MDIPYQFGIREPCAIHSGFALGCNLTADGNRTVGRTLPVMGISVEESRVRVRFLISTGCYNPANGNTSHSRAWVNITPLPYWFSDKDSKLFVIGCKSMAYVRGASVSTSWSSLTPLTNDE